MNLDKIFQPIREDMRAVDALTNARLRSRASLARRVAEHILLSGGKRLRPALVLLSARAHGYRGNAHHRLAAAVEFIHTASLLHDDVVDDSRLRRGRETANTFFGNAPSILVGDFLYSRAFEMMVEVGEPRVMQALSEATSVIAEGEILQLMNCRNAGIGEAEYLDIIRCKTARFFETAARVGAILGNVPPETEQSIADYGMHLGVAFQLIDDVLDYSGQESEIGKSLGDDLAEGKPTLPLIHVLRNGTPEQKDCVRKALETSRRGDFEEVLSAIRASGALMYAKQMAETEGRLAVAAIENLPSSPFKDSLLELSCFAVARDF